jgi:hypothetical protein
MLGANRGGALALFLVSFVDLLVSIQLWHSVRKNPGKGQPTLSAIIANAQEENLRNLIPFLEDPSRRQLIIDALLGQLASQKEKTRKPRKPLMPVSPSQPPLTSNPLPRSRSKEKTLEAPGIAA